MPKFALALFVTLVVVAADAAAQVKAEESVVGRSAPATQQYTISRNGVHYAVLTPKGTGAVVVIDGVEGPQFDELLSPRVSGFAASVAVVFSDDGTRHAYLARIGSDYILVVDGKEVYRSALLPSRTNIGYSPLQFSPGGKHVFFVDLKPGPDGNGRAHLIMDGKPGPTTGNQAMEPRFSPDESRYAYNAVKINGRIGGSSDQMLTVVDGKEMPFNGFDPVFTADNKLLTSLKAGAPSMITVPDGVSTGSKAGIPGGTRFRTIIGPAPVGSRWAGVRAARKPGDPSVLFLDGKEVPEATNPEEVIFSPDGKRYMAICRDNTNRGRFVVVDGRKGPDFQSIVAGLTRFTADSSKAVYVGQAAGKYIIVLEQKPSEPFAQLAGSDANRMVVSQKGGRVGYIVGDGSGINQTLFIDGKPISLDGRSIVPNTLSFSPDGSRYAYVASVRSSLGPSMALVVDGQEMPGIALGEFVVPNAGEIRQWWADQFGENAKYYAFSPDGKHIVYSGIRAADKQAVVFVDGKALFVAVARNSTSFPTWTPDSKHLYFLSQERSKERPQPYNRVFLNGKATTARAFDFQQPATFGTWQVGANGALQFIVFEGPVAKRYRIAPGAEPGIDAVLASAK